VIMASTAVIPALTLAKYGSIFRGIIAAVILQVIALSLYFRYLKNRSVSISTTYFDLLFVLIFSIILGGITIGYSKFLQKHNLWSSVLFTLFGAIATLAVQSISINATNKLNGFT
jgi:cytochrome c biogenesis factor